MEDTGILANYLEAAPKDFENPLAWASSGYLSTELSGTFGYIGGGRISTDNILDQDPDAPAAFCYPLHFYKIIKKNPKNT